MTIFDLCTASHGGDAQLVMKCVSNWMESETGAIKLANEKAIDGGAYITDTELLDWLLILCGSMVFFMQAGFAMVCAGAIRKKNVNNTLIKNLLDACCAGGAFFMLGYGIAYGNKDNETSSSFLGNDNFFLMGDFSPSFFFFQYSFSATAVTIIAGTLAERCKMTAYVAYSVMMTAFVYPVVAHTFWSNQGYFSPSNVNPLIGIGMIDFSGSGVVHVTGGSVALYAAYILGARRGRFHDKDGRLLAVPGLVKGHSMALQMLGTILLWFCWYGFNSGSALLLSTDSKGYVAAIAAVNTTLSAVAATLSALFANGFLLKRQTGEFSLDIVMAMNGCLSGLVAVTAGCGVIEHGAAFFIGIVAGWVYIASDFALIKYQLDDAVSAIPVHLANGVWGVVAVGLFASPERLVAAYGVYSHPGCIYAPLSNNLLPAQLVGVIAIIAWTFVTMVPYFMFLDYMGWFRVNELEEIIGLDATYGRVQHSHFDEENSFLNNEEIRRAAYRQRFKERKQIQDSQPVEEKSAKQMLKDYVENAEKKRVGRVPFRSGRRRLNRRVTIQENKKSDDNEQPPPIDNEEAVIDV